MTIIKPTVKSKSWPVLASFTKICSAVLVGSLLSMSVSAQQESDPGADGNMPPLITPTPTPIPPTPTPPITGCDIDSTPPYTPYSVLLVGTRDTEVDIHILGSGGGDFWGFKVYTTEGVSFFQFPFRSGAVTLTGLTAGTQYSIYSTGVDRCANESSPSETITFITPDSVTAYVDTAYAHYYAGRLDWSELTAMVNKYGYSSSFQLWQMHDASWSDIDPDLTPDAPTGLNIENSSVFESGYTLTWNSVSDADLAYYSVYRDGEYQKLVTEETVTLYNIPQGSSIAWTVSATDMSGNESVPSDGYVMNMPWVTPTPTITPTPICHEVSAYNYTHKTEGRATSSGSYWSPDYIAVGSGDSMEGSTWGTTILYSFDESLWSVGYCP